MIMQEQKRAVQHRRERTQTRKGTLWALAALTLFVVAHVAIEWVERV